MLSSTRFYTSLALAGLFVLSLSSAAEAQLIRRIIREGIQIRAPFVRVNVGPNPRAMAHPRYATPPRHYHPHQVRQAQAHLPLSKKPDSIDVDALPYPTTAELRAMKDTALVETLRQMMARLHYRLSRLKTGEGWQKYLVLSRDTLGAPGTSPKTIHFDEVRRVLPRYQSVQDDPQFAKISVLSSFAATFAALQEADRRFGSTVENPESLPRPVVQPATGPAINGPVIEGPAINGPVYEESGPAIIGPNNYVEPATLEETIEENPAEQPLELQLTPEPAEVPNADRGERSILKRN